MGDAPYISARGGELRRLRLRMGLTQELLASRAGVAERTVRHAEAGDRVTPTTARLLATVLDVRPAATARSTAAPFRSRSPS